MIATVNGFQAFIYFALFVIAAFGLLIAIAGGKGGESK